MIGLLLWLAGAVGFVYEITARNMWKDVLGAVLGAGFVLWVFGGALLITMKAGGLLPKQQKPATTAVNPQKLAEIIAARRAEAGPKAP